MKIQISNAKAVSIENNITLFLDLELNTISQEMPWESNIADKIIDASNLLLFSGAKDYSFLYPDELLQYKNIIKNSGISRIYNIHTDFKDGKQIDESWLGNKQYITHNFTNHNSDIVLHQNININHAGSLINVLEYAKTNNQTIHINAQLFNPHKMLADDSHISARLGLAQSLSCYETSSLAYILELIKQVKCNTSIYNISCAESLELLKNAKNYAKNHGFNITNNIDIHYLLLTNNDIGYFNTYAKFYPPLRSIENQKSLIQGLLDGTIDYIYSGHKNINIKDKEYPFASAVSGASSIKIFIPLLFKTALLHNLNLNTILNKAGIITDISYILENYYNNFNEIGLVLFDENQECILSAQNFNNQASPFLNYPIQGKISHSFC